MYLKCSSNLNHSTSLPKPSLIYILPFKTKDMCIAHTVWHTSRTIPKKKYPKSTFLSALCLNVQVHRFWLSSVTYPNLMGKNPNLPPPKKLPGVSVVSSCSPKPSTSQWKDACGTWHQRWCSHSNGACCANVARQLCFQSKMLHAALSSQIRGTKSNQKVCKLWERKSDTLLT